MQKIASNCFMKLINICILLCLLLIYIKFVSGNANDSNIEGFCVISRMDHFYYLEYCIQVLSQIFLYKKIMYHTEKNHAQEYRSWMMKFQKISIYILEWTCIQNCLQIYRFPNFVRLKFSVCTCWISEQQKVLIDGESVYLDFLRCIDGTTVEYIRPTLVTTGFSGILINCACCT